MRHALALLQNVTGRPFVYGMIHVPALPGTPQSRHSIPEILEIVREEAEVYRSAGIDGVIVENMHDIPYVKKNGPEIISAMTMACSTVSEVFAPIRSTVSLGLQILAGDNRSALAVAHICGFDLVRAECFVFSHIADEGWMDGCAGELLRYRRAIGADDVAVFTDIKKKHSAHAVTSDVSLTDTANAARFFLADGVIITGKETGDEADPNEVQAVREHNAMPVLVGSGVDINNVDNYRSASGIIVGSSFKVDGKWQNPLDEARIRQFMHKVKS